MCQMLLDCEYAFGFFTKKTFNSFFLYKTLDIFLNAAHVQNLQASLELYKLSGTLDSC